ncbi:protein TolB [mine drainage metagenome]|uniref:Protein TolB n=1 Tax=mine drainage metagenome TaxID=410659 RepID=A0A1J5SZC2_9ZZZZ
MKDIHNVLLMATIGLHFLISQSFAADVSVGSSVAGGEQLIAKNVINMAAKWCGNDDVVLNTERFGPILVNLSKGGQRKFAKGGNISAINCSPDGKWLVTVDTDSARYDRDTAGHEDYGHGVKDFSRINLNSGKNESFAVAQGGGEWSPDGTKILFIGKAPHLSIKQPDPKWEFYWSHDWSSGSGGVAAWMPDSKNLLLGHRGKFYLQDGQDLAPLDQMLTRGFGEIAELKIDGRGNIYVSTTNTSDLAMMYQLFKCSIDIPKIICVKIVGAASGAISFDISRDGQRLVLVNEDNSSLYLTNTATLKSKKIAENVSGSPSISPDGKRVAFYRESNVEIENAGFDSDDAFVMPLN